MTYGLLAVCGVARVPETPSVLGAVEWTAAALLVALSVLTWRQSKHVLVPDAEARWTGHGMSYLTGLTVGISYPPVMLTWLMGVALVKAMNLVVSFSPWLAVGFVLSGGAGLFSYMAVLTLVLSRTHHFYGAGTVRLIYRGLSILLGVIAGGFFVNGAFRLAHVP